MAERLDAVCDRFEAACGGGLRPRIDDYLEGVEEPARAVLARELIVLDLHYRHCRAEVPQVTDYDSVNPDRESNWLACAVAALTEGSTPPELPGYEILGELGRGGMGVVYKAQDHRLGRLVALKVLHGPRCQDPEALERFRREARTASALNHPHICTIYTLEEHRGQPFLVMEFIEGHTLRARVDAGPPLAQLLRWIGQVARALQAAHAAGIVHRDIKPENLLVRPDDVVKVLDFGVARLLPDGALRALTLTGKATEPGTLIGTARYMAPEQARCEAVGSPADLFSLGIVLYELATGRHPFEAASAVGTLNALIEQQPLSPSRLNPKLTGALEGLMLRMLEKDPRRRPPADEVAAVLDGLAQAPTLRAHLPGDRLGRRIAAGRQAPPRGPAARAGRAGQGVCLRPGGPRPLDVRDRRAGPGENHPGRGFPGGSAPPGPFVPPGPGVLFGTAGRQRSLFAGPGSPGKLAPRPRWRSPGRDDETPGAKLVRPGHPAGGG